MSKICAALLLLLATVITFTTQAHAQTQPKKPYNLILSGAGGGTFYVDDDFYMSVNGTQVYSDGTAGGGNRPSFTFQASPGDLLTYHVDDTYGYHAGLGYIYLHCPTSNTLTLIDKGFDEYTPLKDNGTVYTSSYLIPTTLPGCSTASVAAVEVTQAIQQFQLLADLEASLAASGEPPVPIISNKPGVLRVYFAAVTDATTVSLTLSGVLSQTKTISLQPNCAPTDQRAGTNGCQSMDFYFTPPSGAWTADIILNDANGNQLQHETLNFKSRDTQGVVLKAASACLLPGGFTTAPDKVCGDSSLLAGRIGLAQSIYPTASVTSAYSWNSVAAVEKNGPDWLSSIARQTDALYSAYDATVDSVQNTRTTYISIYNAHTAVQENGLTGYRNGHGATVPDQSTTLGQDDTADTIAHEASHTLNLLHTNTNVPAPSSPPGCESAPAVDPDTYWQYASNRLQDAAGLENGFNVTTQKILDPTVTFDIMGYCTPQWISPINYNRMIAALGGGAAVIQGHPSPASGPAPTPHPAVPQPGNFWQISGILTATPATLDPVFLIATTGNADAGSGPYSLQVRDAVGKTLYSRAFTPAVQYLEHTTGQPQGDTYFSQSIPYTAGAASFVILDPTGAVLKTLPITGAAPTVAFTSLPSLTGTANPSVSWSITDPDSTAFTSRVVYSPDNGTNWYQVSQTAQTGTAPGSPTTGTDTINFASVPGSPTALLRVYVTDGVNTGVATSAPFNAPRHLPTTIVISSPVSGITQAAANPVLLTGSAFDPDDGFLSGKSLVWSSDIQGALGTGSPLSAALKAGTHTLTLTATDSDGNAITATTKITLGGGAPTLTLTTNAVTASCTNATIAAAPGAQGAPLTLVQYSLDGGVTYTTIPLTKLPYSFLVPGTGAINLVARVYDASNQSAAQSARLTLTGTCVTQTLTALSGSGQFAPVTGTFLAPLKAQLLDYAGNPIPGVTVTFSDPTGAVASATLAPATAVTAADGTATTLPTANAVAGSYTVTAATPTLTAPFTLTNTDFSIVANAATVTIQHGASLNDTIALTGLGGFNSSVAFTCTTLPPGVTCSFSPSNLTPTGGTGTTTLTIATTADAKSGALHPLFPVTSTIATCGLLILFRRRRRIATILTLALAFAAISTLTGCGGFPAFTSTITVNATAGSVVRTTPITVHIQ